jgi:hypothetical protein
VQESEVAMQLDVAFVIHHDLIATSSFIEGRPLVSLFANVLGGLSLLQASEFEHVCLMKASAKLLFLVVIDLLLFLVLITLLLPLPCGF